MADGGDTLKEGRRRKRNSLRGEQSLGGRGVGEHICGEPVQGSDF